MQTIIVTDEPDSWSFLSPIATIIEASRYLANEAYYQDTSLRVINLCSSYLYQSTGYYVSLLAQARSHKAIPSVHHIQDVINTPLLKPMVEDLDEEIQHNLQNIKSDEFIFSVYFGQNVAKKYLNLSKKLATLFPLPLLRFTFEKKKHWSIKKLELLCIQDVPEQHQAFMHQASIAFLSKKRFHQWKQKKHYYELAILIDPQETNPPSGKQSLEAFLNAGESMGLHVEFIEKQDIKFIAEYDALFIRTTTNVNHYTYRFARRALQENLIVIDDPQSIVKCSNKVYLAELMRSHHILTPQTTFINKHDRKLPKLEYPCVLKKPDGAFSQGVIKIESAKELPKILPQFFKTSDLVLVQPFIPTEFDWRIGVLDNKVLYACRYFMAKGHWQLFNWANEEDSLGHCETFALDQVPEGVLKTALKATKVIGDGLYGVDIKSHEEKHYVIEVNDNPSIDTGWEDHILGDTLYESIMGVFIQRIRRKHGYV
jgi:glutathione synthase/RimK-type ligase-like ATP-grasp enzyme